MAEFIPRILYGASGGLAERCARIGINVVLDNDFSRRTWTSREAHLKMVAEYGVKLIPWMAGIGSHDDPNIDPNKTFWENWWDEKREFVERYRDDERIYAWNTVQEPDLGDKDPDPTLEELYSFIRKYDPGGKPCFVLWDQWDAHGYRCKSGQFDLWTMDTFDSGAADVQAFKDRLLRLNKYYHWIEIGKPAIAHFYKFEALEASFRAWQEVVPAGIVGTMYYNSAIVMASASIKAAIKAFHQSMGWWPPAPPPPPIKLEPAPKELPPETIEEIRDSYWVQGFQIWRPGSIVDDSENGAQSGYVAILKFSHAWSMQASMMAQYGFENREYDIFVRIRGTSDNIRWGVYDRTSSTWRKAEASLYGITNEYRTLHLGKFNHLWSDHDIYLYLPGKDDHVYCIDWLLFKSDTEEKYLPTALPAPPVYTCPYCPATFDSEEELNAHITAEHPEEPPIGEVVPWYKKYAPHLAIGGALAAVLIYFGSRK